MTGMNKQTGQAIDEIEHIRQSVADILLTPLGSRLQRRDYGSLIPTLIDQPFNGITRMRLMAATVMALLRWEPRIKLSRVDIQFGTDRGAVVLELTATRKNGPRSGQAVSLSLPLAGGLA